MLSKQKFYLIPLVLHVGLIEDTGYSLKALGLQCAALGVDKFGQRPLHLTWGTCACGHKYEVSMSYPVAEGGVHTC